ncbi:MAG: hypothetical protein JOZ37_07425 [Actinobacteria bacterium]|nr:hypothetical protein [Actinomycetota bacterium]MBV8960250.1 hypothetical protein [Actinomycetota bacterium]MBV9255024.1 hypothetical protein [Actinomycetota bacterium]MBV9663781.1 hypothetical protein [Actinomycetota bacterium]MBV9933045.1 hypothetical protein [Actinomycetota bacterium]
MSFQSWNRSARQQPFGMQGPLDQSRLDEFLRAVGQLDVPPTSAAHLDAAASTRRPNLKGEGRESR